MIESTNSLLASSTYSPNRLLDMLVSLMGLKNDAALARSLDMTPIVLSKFRHLKIPIGATALISMHEASGISIRELKRLAGIPAMERHASK